MNTQQIPVLVALVICATTLPAQETRSMIYGRVLDPQSTVVSSASVTVTNTDTNASHTLTTNEAGYYEDNLLIPGNYQVRVEAAGFKKSIRNGILLPIGTRLQIDVTLALGTVT